MPSVSALLEPFDRSPLAREAMIAVALVTAFAIWLEFSGDLARDVLVAVDVPSFGSRWFAFALNTATPGVLTVVGMLAFAGGYVYLRDVDLRIGHLDRSVLAFTAGGLVVGTGLIGLVKGLATATGTTVSEITNTGIAVVAVGVTAYQRTKSLLPSALAYVSFVVAADLVVYCFEAGIGI